MSDPQDNTPPAPSRRMCGALHENVPVWSDTCCSCEAEPYWLEQMAAEETESATGKEADGQRAPKV